MGPLPYVKINSINVSPESIKFLVDTTRKKLLDIGIRNNVSDMTPKTQATKAQINKWVCIKLRSFYIAKETVKFQPMEWEKILAHLISDNGLIFKIYK